MLRTLLITTALLTASSASFAHDNDDYGRVVSVEPRFVISFGNSRPDGFRVVYDAGGNRYRTHAAYYPGPVVVSPQYRIRHVHYYRDDERRHDDRREYGRGWDDHRGGWGDDGERRGYRHHDDD